MRGDIATAAKAIADYARATQLLPFKGGLMDGAALDPAQIRSLSRLPSREVLYGQLVGVVASPVSGLVCSLSALIGGLASALGQVREKKESGEIPAGDAPAVEASTVEEAPSAEETPAASEEPDATDEAPPAAEEPAEAAPESQAEPEQEQEPAQENDDNPKADATAEDQSEDAEATKED